MRESKMTKAKDVMVAGLFALLLVSAASATLHADDNAALLEQAQALFKPLPPVMGSPELPAAQARVVLGRTLFFDPRWTLEGNVSCATCHQPALYGTDALAKSIGVQHRRHPRNAPTVLNAGLNFVQHWWGDRKNLEDQAEKALGGVFSSGHADAGAATARIEAIEGYAAMFRQAFPGEASPITSANVGTAISAYERTLLTPSPFDAYLRGDTRALSPMARRGLQRFISRGCASCHGGIGVGGQMFQKFGLVEEYWKATGSTEIDEGRVGFTKDPADLYVFKVPSLRNVAMTPPYFHDGSVAALDEAVKVMGRVQLGVTLPDTEVGEIVVFLRTLTGPLPANFAAAPVLPSVAVEREP
jgi:cytochrome c peroxidase